MDERRLYINQLLRQYKQGLFSPNHYTVKYQYTANEPQYKIFNHNEGIDFIIEYIDGLHKRIDELEYIKRIIEVANNGLK